MVLPSEGLEVFLEFSYNSQITRDVVTSKTDEQIKTPQEHEVLVMGRPQSSASDAVVLSSRVHSMGSKAVLLFLLRGTKHHPYTTEVLLSFLFNLRITRERSVPQVLSQN